MRFSTSRRKALAGVIGGLGAAGLASCGKAAIIGLDKRARSLDIAIQDEPLTLDPQKCSAPAENLIVGNMFMGLFAENARAEPIPGMAERWEVSEDGLTWTFFLRPATWSDGVRCDAHDFVYAFRRILDPAHAAEYARLLFPLKNAAQVNKGEAPPSAVGVAALGDRILEIQLEHPTPLLPQVLKHHVAYPAPKHVLEAHGDDWIKAENIVVNGPYTLVKWWSNYVVHLRKNPHFLDAGQVRLNDLYFYPTANAASAARGVESGARGWSTDFPSDRYNDLERRLSAYVRVAPNLLTECFFFNCTRAPFDDPRVRQALCMSLDRDFIFSRVLGAGKKPAYALVPTGVGAGAPAAQLAWAATGIETRRAEARRLLAEAGYGPNCPLRFVVEHGLDGARPRLAAAAQGDWRTLAPWVNVTRKPSEDHQHDANMRARNYDVGDGARAADFDDALSCLDRFETRAGPRNYSGFSDPRFDDLMAQAERQPDLVQRGALLAVAEQIVLDAAAACPIVFGVSRNLVHPDLTGFENNIENVHRARWFGIKSAGTPQFR